MDDQSIFGRYDRTSYIHSICKDLSNCPTLCNDNTADTCCCHLNQPVFPFTIGYEWYRPKIKIKTYIRIGEECPICLEPIHHKINAFLTFCGHAFHKKCIATSYTTRRMEFDDFTFRCPLCRTEGVYDSFQRYKHENSLDILEDFWITKEYNIPEICGRIDLCTGKNHYLGMKSSCKRCQCYHKSGWNIS